LGEGPPDRMLDLAAARALVAQIEDGGRERAERSKDGGSAPRLRSDRRRETAAHGRP
jgi:hypothetical protein